MENYWNYLDRLIAESKIVIDRPAGSSHPRYPDLVYPLDYGYLEATTSADGGGVDLWVGSQLEKALNAIALTVDLAKRDVEVKLLLGCTEEENQVIISFLNGASMRATLVHRHRPVNVQR